MPATGNGRDGSSWKAASTCAVIVAVSMFPTTATTMLLATNQRSRKSITVSRVMLNTVARSPTGQVAGRMAGEDALKEQVAAPRVRVIQASVQLLQHHSPLFLQRERIENRIGQHVAEHVQRRGDVRRAHHGMKGNQLPAGGGVETAAPRGDRPIDVERARSARVP